MSSFSDTPHGVIVIDKPRGPTSHDVVARVRRLLETRAVGHAGTLDPMATGVLVVAVGEGTKLVPWLTADDKTYETTVRLGVTTDTLDAEGKETARAPIPDELRAAIAERSPSPLLDAAIAAEKARTMQVPPAFSAIKIAGVRAHELARAGKLDEALPERPTSVLSLEVLGGRSIDDVIDLDLRVASAKGYFVRSLARDLAERLGTVGHLTALRRTRSGGFTTAEAVALETVMREQLIPVAKAASRALPVTILDQAGVRAATFGQRVAPAQMNAAHEGPSAWLDETGRLIAIGERDAEGLGRVLRGFPLAH